MERANKSLNPVKAQSSLARISFIVLAITLAILTVAPTLAKAEDESLPVLTSSRVELSPGSTYDVGTAGRNSDIVIKQSGTYTIKGSTNRASLRIEPDENAVIEVKFSGNVKIDPDLTGRISPFNGTPAIFVGEAQNATVSLTTEAGAQVYAGGYLGNPGIAKNGTATKLVFKTSNPSNPGSITAVGSSSGSNPGIGSVGSKSTQAGNIDFAGGNVSAQGNEAPGIGGSKNGASIMNLTFSGATVSAKGGKDSAGIGTGTGGGTLSNVLIHGGSVTAVAGNNSAGIGTSGSNGSLVLLEISDTASVNATGGSNGAGIGLGNGGGSASSITIKGSARVTATGGDGAAGIGGGRGEGTVRDITIDQNAHVVATGGTFGAGIGSGAAGSNAANITVKSGVVTATGGQCAAGIGAGGGQIDVAASTASNIQISGGTVNAVGGEEAAGIGSGTVKSEARGITVSGGYVSPEAGADGFSRISDIGGLNAFDISISGGTIYGSVGNIERQEMQITVTGGSIENIDNEDIVNANGTPVKRTIVNFRGVDAESNVSSFKVSGSWSAYGTKNLRTMALKDKQQCLIVYIPEQSYADTAAIAGGATFAGNVYGGTEGFLAPSANVTLSSGDEVGTNGNARVIFGNSKADIISHAVDSHGRTVLGYAGSNGQKVMDVEGNLAKNTQYTDEQGRWNRLPQGTVLYAIWNDEGYTIEYDSDVPYDASTEVKGEMPDQEASFDSETKLAANQFILPGYEFQGWSLDPQADYDTDVEYADQAVFDDEYVDVGSVVTLYAVWKPRTYTISYDANGGQGSMEPTQATFDEEITLDENQFTYAQQSGFDPSFAGWADSTGRIYADEDFVVNLCAVDESDGSIQGETLKAQWSVSDEVVLFVTINGRNVDLEHPETSIKLYGSESASNPQTQFSKRADGAYVLKDVDGGTYRIDLDENGTALPTGSVTITVENGKSNVVHLQYATITAKSGDGHVFVNLNGSSQSDDERTLTVLEGGTVTISAALDPSLNGTRVFDGYSVEGTTPDSFDANMADEQTITVKGETTLTARTRQAVFNIAFHENRPSGASTFIEGSMEQMTGLPVGNGCELDPNGFTLPGYTFQGWSLDEGATEPVYQDGNTATFEANDGETVDLYAIWKPIEYSIVFEGNDGTGSMSPQRMAFDTASSLTANAFALDGSHFVGWSTEPDGSEMKFADGESVSNLAQVEGATVVLWAQWERDYYTVAFNANCDNAVGSMDDAKVDVSEQWIVPACGFTAPGKAFVGWNTSPDGSGTAYGLGQTVQDIAAKDQTVDLYAQWRAAKYTVAFDANVPNNASTKELLQGQTTSLIATCESPFELAKNGFSLPGYDFKGWNTAPDGSGTSFEDEEHITNDLSSTDGAEVRLYAQWEPKTYVVTFKSNEGESAVTTTQTMTFDTESSLGECTFNNGDALFLGWSEEGLTGDPRLYSDGQMVENLCDLDGAGVPIGRTLVAQWTQGNQVYIVLTENNAPLYLPNPETDIALWPQGQSSQEEQDESADDGASTLSIEPVKGFNKLIAGVYALSEVTPGTYRIDVEGHPSASGTLTVEAGKPSVQNFDFSTVTVRNADGNVNASLNGPYPSGSVWSVLTGSDLEIEAAAKPGYTFAGYTIEGTTPVGIEGEIFDLTNPEEQTIKILGEVTVTAHAQPNDYFVAFDGNGASGIMGLQKFTYGIPSALNENLFVNEAKAFAGWNTKNDGSGEWFEDRQEISDLTEEQDGVVILYAQWKSAPDPGPGPDPDPGPSPEPGVETYTICFDANGGEGEMPDLEIERDVEWTVLSCLFDREGFDFVEWNLEPDGSGAAYKAGDRISNLAHPGEAVTLYAQWEKAPDPEPEPGPDPEPAPSPDPEPDPKPDPQPSPTPTDNPTAPKQTTGESIFSRMAKTGDTTAAAALLAFGFACIALLGISSVCLHRWRKSWNEGDRSK